MASQTYEQNGANYKFFTHKTLGRNIEYSKQKLQQILDLYCCDHYLSSTEISLKLGVPKKHIEAIVRALAITHKSVPFLDEQVLEGEVDDLSDDMLSLKKNDIINAFEKKKNQSDQEDALKWRKLEQGVFEPVEKYLKNWKPTQQRVIKHVPLKKSEQVLCVGCSDWHYGLVAKERYLYNQKEWNSDKTIEVVADYANKLVNTIESHAFKQINLMFIGDLAHSVTGFTDKGTKLEVAELGEDQIDLAYQSMLNFVESILSVHSNIKVYACSGNHDSVADYILVRMLEIYFRNDKRITFEITNKRFLTFKVFSNLFLMEHGYSAKTKGRLMPAGTSRENYLNNLFLAKPDLLYGVKHRYYLSGDQHHNESYELTNVEGFMFSTLVGGCRYSDNSGYKSRPRQSCLVVTDEGVVEQKHFYFD